MIDINAKIMEAMKSKDKMAYETYKLLKSEILKFKTAKNAKEYNEAEEVRLIQKMIQNRKDSAEIYSTNGRDDLAENELSEATVLERLLPKLPTAEDVEKYINENYPNGIEKRQIGVVIKEIKQTLIGADGKTVSDVVKKHLA